MPLQKTAKICDGYSQIDHAQAQIPLHVLLRNVKSMSKHLEIPFAARKASWYNEFRPHYEFEIRKTRFGGRIAYFYVMEFKSMTARHVLQPTSRS